MSRGRFAVVAPPKPSTGMVIGLGGIGSWLVPLLVRTVHEGSSLEIYDNDNVAPENLHTQNYKQPNLGRNKALSLDVPSIIRLKRYSLKIDTAFDTTPYDYIVSAVDNPETRGLVFDHWKINRDFLLVDPRMGLGTWSLWILPPDADDMDVYNYSGSLEALYTAEEAPCTARATPWTGCMLATSVVNVIAGYQTKRPIPLFQHGDALECELDRGPIYFQDETNAQP